MSEGANALCPEAENPAGLPGERWLGSLFDTLVRNWAPDGPSTWDSTPMEPAVHCCTRLSGPTVVHLSLSAPVEFSYRLAGAVLGRVARREEAEDALRELVNLFGGHFQTEFWGLAGKSRPFLPLRSLPRDWPTRPPDRQSVRWALGLPVTLSLWCDPYPQNQGDERG